MQSAQQGVGGVKAAAAPPPTIQRATGAYILRSLAEDGSRRTKLCSSVTDFAAAAFGPRFANQHDQTIATAVDVLYYMTMIPFGNSLGEEYSSILPVLFDLSGQRKSLLGPIRRLLFALLLALQPLILKRLLAGYATRRNISPDDAVGKIQHVHDTLFYLLEIYPTFAHRLLGVQYVTTARRGQQDERGEFFTVGLMRLAVYAIDYFSAPKKPQQQQQQQSAALDEEGEQREGDDDDEEDGGPDGPGKCTLCLSRRKTPTAASCGHIFCWSCISNWIASNSTPLCPLCRQSLSLASLVPLVQYRPQRMTDHRVGGSTD